MPEVKRLLDADVLKTQKELVDANTATAMLQAAKRKVQADCEVALNQLEGQIQSLLAIESK